MSKESNWKLWLNCLSLFAMCIALQIQSCVQSNRLDRMERLSEMTNSDGTTTRVYLYIDSQGRRHWVEVKD